VERQSLDRPDDEAKIDYLGRVPKLNGFANFYHEFVKPSTVGVTTWQLRRAKESVAKGIRLNALETVQ
jgi:hypothetical protein